MSSASEKHSFACPSCGSRKAWKPEIAGKAARCSCGHVLTVPSEPPGMIRKKAREALPVDMDDPFAAALAAAEDEPAGADDDPPLAPAVAPAAPKRTAFTPPPVVIEREEADGSVTTVSSSRRAAAVVQPPQGVVPYRKPLSREEKPKEDFRLSTFRDVVLPAFLIAAGIALCLIDGRYQEGGTWIAMNQAIQPIMLKMIASLALAVGAVFGASAMGGIAFSEPIPIVILKLCAVALIPAAMQSLSDHWIGGFNGNMAGVFIGLGCYFLLFMLVFPRLPFQDQFVCVMLMLIISSFVQYMVFRLKGAAQGADF